MIYNSIIFILLLLTTSAFAQSSEKYDKAIITTLIYSNLPKSATICIFNDQAMTNRLNQYFKQSNSNYSASLVNANNFVRTNCQAVFFSDQSPKVQNDLINRYPTRVLSISATNPLCEMGSAVCLSQGKTKINVMVNMSALSRAKVEINPHVLKMWSGQNK